jgi:hypothetical protein
VQLSLVSKVDEDEEKMKEAEQFLYMNLSICDLKTKLSGCAKNVSILPFGQVALLLG